MKRSEVVELIKETVRRIAPGAKTILYGSEARGDARPDSDIDLLILVDGDTMTLSGGFTFRCQYDNIPICSSARACFIH